MPRTSLDQLHCGPAFFDFQDRAQQLSPSSVTLQTFGNLGTMHPRIALLLCHLLLVIALEDPLLEASSAQNRLDAGPPESSIHEPLPEDTVRICPLPWCKRCPTAEENRAPGIGFSLEMGYGYVTLLTRWLLNSS